MKKWIFISTSTLILLAIVFFVCVKFLSHESHEHGTHDHEQSAACNHEHEGADHDEHEHEGADHDEHKHEGADHDEHEHGHEGEEIVLKPGALKNIGLDSPDAVMDLQVGSFTRTHRIPAIVMEYEGRTTSKVPARYAGVITKIYHEPGESVIPGEPLFDLTLILPEIMDQQAVFLKLLETKEFLESEIAEIDKNLNGLAPQRRREMDVRLKETEIEIRGQRNTLLLLGLSDEQISQVEKNRKSIINVIQVKVPPVSHHGFISEQNPGESDCSVVFENLYVNVGATVEVGQTLCDLCDLCELTVRGDAFAVNEKMLLDALQNPETPVRMVFNRSGKAPLENLRLRMVESKVDETNRTLSCFADFENVKLKDEKLEPETHPHKPRYIHWLYKPGERGIMEIAYETVPNVFVVPVAAVATDVNETFVFELEEELENGEKVWHKHPVHLLFRTSQQAILANDGSVKPGIRVASLGASFLLDALNAQNGSGTKIDPHAGHNH